MGSHSVTCHPPLHPAEAGTRFGDPSKAQLTYVTWKWTGRELNPRPVDRKSNALPQCHHAVCKPPPHFVDDTVQCIVNEEEKLPLPLWILSPCLRRNDWATAIGNTHKKFGKDCAYRSGDILANRQTHKDTHTHTDRHAHYNTLQLLPWAK